jgi:hypothetical protein
MDSQTRRVLVRKIGAVKARMTHIKKFIDILPDTVDLHDVNVRLQLLEKVREEYKDVRDQLEYNEDEMQQHEPDREAGMETYGVLQARINKMISEDRQAGEVKSAESHKV